MPFNKFLKPDAGERQDAGRVDEHWLVAELESAQRGNLYAAGRGDGPGRTSRRWSIKRGGRADRII